jgi:hypothetical protein
MSLRERVATLAEIFCPHNEKAERYAMQRMVLGLPPPPTLRTPIRRLRRAEILEKLKNAEECEMCGANPSEHSGTGWWATLRRPDAAVVCVRCEKSSRNVRMETYVARAKALVEYRDSGILPHSRLFATCTLAPIRPRHHRLNPGVYYELATRPCEFTGMKGIQNYVVANAHVCGITPMEMLRDSGVDEFYERLRRVIDRAPPPSAPVPSSGVDPAYVQMQKYAGDLEIARRKSGSNVNLRRLVLSSNTSYPNVTPFAREKCEMRLREYAKYVPRLAKFFDRRANTAFAPPNLEEGMEFMYAAYYAAPGKKSIRSVKERLGSDVPDHRVRSSLAKMREDRAPLPLPAAAPEKTPPPLRKRRIIPVEHIKAVYDTYFDERGMKRQGASIDAAIMRTGSLHCPQNMMRRIREMHRDIHGA